MTACARRSPPRWARPTWTVTATTTDHSGSLFIEPDELAEAAGRLADLGFQMHFHAIGDRAVSAALDALAALPRSQRVSGRHHIAHLQFVSPADLERFAKLGVTGNFQPLWACKDDQNDKLTLPFVGLDRASWQYRIGSLLRLGTRVAFGSDWPVSSADPLQELHVAVNRVLSAHLGAPGTTETTVPLLPAEAVGVRRRLDAFTRGVAYVNHEEDVAGTLEPGKIADFAVLDQDLYTIPPNAIGDTIVALTIASGQVVLRGRITADCTSNGGREAASGSLPVMASENSALTHGHEHRTPARDLVPLMCCI